MGLAMETICTFFLNYEQYIILLTMCFFAGMAWRHHRVVPNDIAANLFNNVGTVEISEYREPNAPILTARQCPS